MRRGGDFGAQEFDRFADAIERNQDLEFDAACIARQVVGMLARRVVCRVAPGATVRAGDRFGIMKFGSRMDVFLPPDATLMAKVGDMVRGGETVIAMLHCPQGAKASK